MGYEILYKHLLYRRIIVYQHEHDGPVSGHKLYPLIRRMKLIKGFLQDVVPGYEALLKNSQKSVFIIYKEIC